MLAISLILYDHALTLESMTNEEAMTPSLRRSDSRVRQAARRVGIIIETPKPHLPTTEQEQADIM